MALDLDDLDDFGFDTISIIIGIEPQDNKYIFLRSLAVLYFHYRIIPNVNRKNCHRIYFAILGLVYCTNCVILTKLTSKLTRVSALVPVEPPGLISLAG